MGFLACEFYNDFRQRPKAHHYRPHHFTRISIVYTATHDHNTTVGWFTVEPGKETTLSKEEIEGGACECVLGTDGQDIHWDMIRLAMSSVDQLSMVPLQDVLGMGSESRMNRPGTLKRNREWRFHPDQLTEEIGERLRNLTGLFDRLLIPTLHEP